MRGCPAETYAYECIYVCIYIYIYIYLLICFSQLHIGALALSRSFDARDANFFL